MLLHTHTHVCCCCPTSIPYRLSTPHCLKRRNPSFFGESL